MKHLLFILILSGAITSHIYAQGNQTIRGVIIDNQLKEPLIGASVYLDEQRDKAVASDTEGRFKITGAEPGRHTLNINMMGYKAVSMHVIVTSGKEVVVNIELDESVTNMKEITVSAAGNDKAKVNNEMSTVSARGFTIEETSRYAGSRNDPSRMATNFAGVSGANDSRNDIIIRGNSPTGLLWRLNGLDIPNPNHFGSIGSTGGPVSILNNNVLDNSDFMTGAFPAEYANGTSGVFDLKMRKGNDEKHEFMGQIGFNGFEAGAEGPISKASRSSYLVNYRYSTLGLFSKIGVNFGTGAAIPQYQDVSMKIDFPGTKLGSISVFGIGGTSNIALLDSEKDTTQTDLYTIGGKDTWFNSDMGVAGISHTIKYSEKTFAKTSIGASGMQTRVKQNDLDYSSGRTNPEYGNRSYNVRYSAIYNITTKWNAANSIKAGFALEQLRFSLKDSLLDKDLNRFIDLRNARGNTWFFRSFAQWQHKFSDKLILNTGINYQQLTLNNSYSIEPRGGLRYIIDEKQSISLGGGMHSQMQNLLTYFAETRTGEGYIRTNKNLDFTRSNQAVVAYDRNLGNDMRIKSEAYYQYLYDIPVLQRASYFSAINLGADFATPNIDSLVNKGTGENYGIELTIEKFYSKGYYFLLTGSLFESTYKGSNNIKYNTVFNGNYVSNALLGKEWKIGKKLTFNADAKATMAGGKRYIPILEAASAKAGEAVLDESSIFEKRYKDYFRADVRFAIRLNGKHLTQEFALDIQNVSNNKNIFMQNYDAKNGRLVTEYQMGLFIIPQFRILF